MPNYFAKRDTTKVDSTKKGDIRFQSNLLDIVGGTLMQSAQKGKFSSGPLQNFSADIDVDLGKGYSANLGYNKYMKDLRQDIKLTLSKKF